MTSEATLKDSKDYFADNSYFGLDAANVVFFEQHQLPCLTFEGKLILAGQGKGIFQGIFYSVMDRQKSWRNLEMTLFFLTDTSKELFLQVSKENCVE